MTIAKNRKLLFFLVVFVLALGLLIPTMQAYGEETKNGTFNGRPACVNGNGDLHLCEANFPDDVFRDKICDHGFGAARAEGDYVTKAEVDAVTTMSVGHSNINTGMKSLEGIEFFTNLTSFSAPNGMITDVDFSNNLKLKSITLSTNKLESIDVSMLSELTALYLGYSNELTELDVSHNMKLDSIFFGGNHLTTLELSHVPNISISLAGSAQTTTGAVSYIDGKWAVNMTDYVPAGYLNRVTQVNGGAYDGSEVLALADVSPTAPTSFTYSYKVNLSNPSQLMNVTVNLTRQRGTVTADDVTYYLTDDSHPSAEDILKLTNARLFDAAGTEMSVDKLTVSSTHLQELYDAIDSNDIGKKIYLTIVGPDGSYWTPIITVAEPEPQPSGPTLNVARLYGADRYKTSAQVSQYTRSASDVSTVILASGEDGRFPDALSASVVSGAENNAPIVLTSHDALSAEAKAVIESLKPSKIILMGDKNALSSEVEKAAAAYVGSAGIERLGGADRQETAELAYKSRAGSLSNTAIITRCDEFADSLSVSSWAATAKAPIFLTEFGNNALTQETLDALSAGGFTRILVLGDTNSVPESVAVKARDAANLSSNDMVRLGGEDRFATSFKIAQWATSSDRGDAERLSVDKLALTRGDKSADALTGGALQGKDRSVVLLTTQHAAYADILTLLATNSSAISEIRFFGDEYSLPHSTMKEFIDAIGPATVQWMPDDSVKFDLS